MSALAAAACRNHPEREAIGVCVTCRTRVCAECSTKVDGINHCVACLAALAGGDRRSTRSTAGSRSPRAGAIAGGALLVTVTALAWAMLEIALPG